MYPFIRLDVSKSWFKQDISTTWLDGINTFGKSILCQNAYYIHTVIISENILKKCLEQVMLSQKIPDFSVKENQYSPPNRFWSMINLFR